jgi:hypothetical protein
LKRAGAILPTAIATAVSVAESLWKGAAGAGRKFERIEGVELFEHTAAKLSMVSR